MIKAIFFDIDGTLVSFNTHRISETTLDVLYRLKAGGVKLFIASGRHLLIMDNLSGFPFDGYVCMNGSLVFDRGEMIYIHPMDREDAASVVDLTERENIPCVAFAEKEIVLNCRNELTDRVFDMIHLPSPKPVSFAPFREKPVCQFTIFVDKEKEEKYLLPVLKHSVTARWHPEFTDIDPEDITAISYDAGDGERAFEKQDGTWVYTTDADFPLKQDFPETIAEDMGQLRADRELVDGDELADYGLEEPVYTVTLTQSDGTVTEIYFGNTVDDYYYVTVNDDGVVYTVSSTAADNLTQSLDEMAQLDEYPSIGSGNLKKVSITENGETTAYDSENEDQSEDISGIAGGLGAVTLSEAADYSVADADLAGYGLDEASRITVEVTYTEDDEDKTMTLYIGGDNGDSSRYVMIDDSRIVYLISDEICSNILNED